MTSTTSTNAAPRETGLAPAATLEPQASPGHLKSNAVREPVDLDHGDVPSIRGGQGTKLTPASGALWITGEGSANDILGKSSRPAIGALAAAIGAAVRKAVAMARELWTKRAPSLPTTVEFENDGPSVRHSRLGLGAPPWDDPVRSAGDPLSRGFPFPYY
jgi:hypothetical protein